MNHLLVLLALLGGACLAYSDPTLNVHLIAHSHDDVGWLKTVDQYYYGANQSIQYAGVQYIIDTVVTALQENSERRFIYVEIAFFMRWWREQSEYKRQIVRDLVARKQLEFINGGWVMNDEATTSHTAIIEQMAEGHEFLYREFGVRPRIGWHIDPFGHAASQPSLFAQMGFDAFFINRIDYKDHELRNETAELEFVWRGSDSLGRETDMWTHVLYIHYSYLQGFGFEEGAPPIQSDPHLFDLNIKERCDLFAQEIRRRSISFKTNHIFVPMGDDFQYMNAHLNFKNMDKLIKYMNDNAHVYNMKVFYSTPTTYVDAVNQAAVTWQVKTGDFLPYANQPHAYWAGFYTSRPALKGYVRTTNAFLHATQQIAATTALTFNLNAPALVDRIQVLTQAFSTAQHHDAVTGTEKQHVADDYAKRLAIGTQECEQVLNEMIKTQVSKLNANPNLPNFEFCKLINESVCQPCQSLKPNATLAMVAYNPLAWARNETLRIPVGSNTRVLGPTGEQLPSNIYINQDQVKTLVFQVQLPALGFTTYFLEAVTGETLVESSTQSLGQDLVLENQFLSVVFDGQTHRLKNITDLTSGHPILIDQELMWWNSSAGNNNASSQASGAYCFRPNGTTPFPMNPTQIPTTTITQASLFQEVVQVWNSWAKQTFRLYAGAKFLEVEATIGPIDIKDGLGKEVIARYSTNLKTNAKWYTDSEGQEFQERIRNHRPYPYNITEPVAMNYYPMNAAAYIKDAANHMSLVSDRSRGCSSLEDGQFENMLHRRMLYDDGFGVGEPLNESNIVRTTDRLLVGPIDSSAKGYRSQMLLLNSPPVLMFAQAGSAISWIKNNIVTWAAINKPLPDSVELITFKLLRTGNVLVRLQNIYAANEDSNLSQPVTVDLTTLMPSLQIETATEVTLSANRPISELHRLKWQTAQSGEEETIVTERELLGPQITLRAQQIRSFIIRYSPVNPRVRIVD